VYYTCPSLPISITYKQEGVGIQVKGIKFTFTTLLEWVTSVDGCVAPAPDNSPSPVAMVAISAAAHDKLLFMPGQFDPLRHPDYYEKESKE
jgi:hypothetical protein